MVDSKYLRPSADTTLEHTPSDGQTGYNLINEIIADDDSTTIASTASKDTSVTKTSQFILTGTMQSGHKITAANAVCVVKTSGADSCSLTVSVGQTSESKNIEDTNYTTYTYPLKPTDIIKSGENTSANLTIKTVLKADRKKTAKCFITQVYIEIMTEEYIPPPPPIPAFQVAIMFADIKQRIVDFIMSVCDNCKNNVSFSELKLNTRTVETKSYVRSQSTRNSVRHSACASSGKKEVIQNGWDNTYSKLSSSDILTKVNELFAQNNYVTRGETVINAANFYNICYIVSRFLYDTIQIYASPCVNRNSNGNITPRKVVIFDNTIDTFPYGKPEYIDKNYTAEKFQTYFNNLFDQLFNVRINTVTYSVSI